MGEIFVEGLGSMGLESWFAKLDFVWGMMIVLVYSSGRRGNSEIAP
jgi:hypothetical protein